MKMSRCRTANARKTTIPHRRTRPARAAETVSAVFSDEDGGSELAVSCTWGRKEWDSGVRNHESTLRSRVAARMETSKAQTLTIARRAGIMSDRAAYALDPPRRGAIHAGSLGPSVDSARQPGASDAPR